MRKALILICALLLAAGGVATLQAATADFQANCDGLALPIDCVFDANRQSSYGPGTSCGSASVDQYFWDFGDGAFKFTTSSFVAHRYAESYCEGDFVSLAVFCSDNSSATISHCYCSTVGINGCIRPGAGWTP